MIFFQVGNLLSFHGKCALVTAVNKEKIEIRIEGGSTKSVRAKDVEYIHPGPCTALLTEKLPLPEMEEILQLMEEELFPFLPKAPRRLSRIPCLFPKENQKGR